MQPDSPEMEPLMDGEDGTSWKDEPLLDGMVAGDHGGNLDDQSVNISCQSMWKCIYRGMISNCGENLAKGWLSIIN